MVLRQLQGSRQPELEHPFAVAIQDDVVGFFLLREKNALPEWASQNVLTMHNFRIGLKHQGKGYGRAGIELAVRWMKRNRPEVNELMLAVNARNASARAAYLKCGFIDTHETYCGPIGEQNILTYKLNEIS